MGTRECLRDLVGREHRGRAFVDAIGIGLQCQGEHHVGQVDGLAPRGGADLQPGDVDQLQVPALDEQVGGLDVAVGDADVPELSDQLQALVDDRVVDLGIAEVLGVLEELGDEHVLAVGRELDDAPGLWRP